MRVRTTLLALVAASTSLFATPVAAQADEVEPFIIGGGTVSSAPWSAQIYRNGSFTCSGTIIAARYVLTARHCTGSAMTVRVGSVTRGSGTLASVSTYSTRYDLAVLTLATSISTSYMPLASANPPTNSTNSIYGWGMTCYEGCSAATQLKTATVRVTGLSTDAYGGQAIASTRVNGNAWRGDSGGPQVYNGQQVGVASTADGVSRQYYGSVAYSRTWIRSVAGV
ncbi:S1 family peptidase [Virgisporangium aurantiacum]|jgi:secreted trypsin-like serine protease|uniref:Serine protease n=1 Tax=Virgisporangium aurantiacum TaxID=175570 RepID=A0A8J3YZL9_9ACTN|nr:trypsin-like serine protease [Virgisporangium aurantiacum]GIJ54569.1 serine protease [Virgisporangium aurantiacum]